MYNPKLEYDLHRKQIDSAIHQVIEHGLFINGPEVEQLECELAKYVGVNYCITVGNGTDGLKISLLALGIGYNDEVITVANTWISTAEVISLIGAKPVFVDIEKDSYNLDPEQLESKISSRTRAIIVVSLYGQIANIDKINQIANKYYLPVIEDGAQSFGAEYRGKKSGSLTTIGVTSFFPSKPLGCYGDGGACFTNDTKLADKIRALKQHGGLERFKHDYIGLNSRLDTIQASILLIKLTYFVDSLKGRQQKADYYQSRLERLELEGKIVLPKILPECNSCWSHFTILTENKNDRDKLVAYLKDNGVTISIFYPVPLHYQKCFEYLGYHSGDLPVTEDVCQRVLNLPCYPELLQDDQDRLILLLLKYYNYK